MPQDVNVIRWTKWGFSGACVVATAVAATQDAPDLALLAGAIMAVGSFVILQDLQKIEEK